MIIKCRERHGGGTVYSRRYVEAFNPKECKYCNTELTNIDFDITESGSLFNLKYEEKVKCGELV